MTKVKLMTVVISAFVAACATTSDYSSPYTKPRVGSVIQLNQEISARNGVRIYLQDGYVLEWEELEKQQPYCQFYVRRPSDQMRQPFAVEPDTFTVSKVYRRKDIGALDGLQLASDGGDVETDQGSSQRTMSTYMALSSLIQPDVTTLICSQWKDPQLRFHVSVDEIITVLGDLAQFIPPR